MRRGIWEHLFPSWSRWQGTLRKKKATTVELDENVEPSIFWQRVKISVVRSFPKKCCAISPFLSHFVPTDISVINLTFPDVFSKNKACQFKKKEKERKTATINSPRWPKHYNFRESIAVTPSWAQTPSQWSKRRRGASVKTGTACSRNNSAEARWKPGRIELIFTDKFNIREKLIFTCYATLCWHVALSSTHQTLIFSFNSWTKVWERARERERGRHKRVREMGGYIWCCSSKSFGNQIKWAKYFEPTFLTPDQAWTDGVKPRCTLHYLFVYLWVHVAFFLENLHHCEQFKAHLWSEALK